MLAYAGRGRIELQERGLEEVVTDISRMLEVTVPSNARLEIDLPADLPRCRGDATQLRQVVMNLITNAAEALGDEPGSIRVRGDVQSCTRADLDAAILGSELPEGDYLRLQVTDTGSGMDADVRSKIFEPFFTTKFTGRGLGMAVVLGIVRGHDGAIAVESAPGAGTTVTVLLPPVGTVEKSAVEVTPASPRMPVGSVLLVDDEPGVLAVGERMLRRLGCEVLTASGGAAALAILREHRSGIACVILDCTMPQRDGQEVLREIRAAHGDVPVVLASGYNDALAARRCVGAEAVDFLTKPYDLDDLRRVLQRAVGGDNQPKP
jgi:CheY-like chemotaxis protein